MLTKYLEVLSRYGDSLLGAWSALLLAFGLFALTLLPASRRLLAKRSRSVDIALLSGACALCLAWAWRLRWICDDAFISFRFAANFANGHGLVWNIGERVEGYTNFLWTLLIGLAIRLGFDPGQFATICDLAALLVTLVVVIAIVRKLTSPRHFPLATLALAANYTFASFGTSGLETMPAALFILLCFERAMCGAPLLAGFFGVLAVFCHPDHFLLYAAIGVALVMHGRSCMRTLLRFGAPFVFLYIPYYILRWRYYGDPMPNTYYAKSGGEAYFAQGAFYLWASFWHANLWPVLPLTMLAAFRHRREFLGCTLIVALPIYFLYVAKIGGDYMVGRLCVSALPLLFIGADVALADFAQRWQRVPAAALLILAMAPTPVLKPREVRWFIADERTHTPLSSFSPIVTQSEMFERAQYLREHVTNTGLRPRIAVDAVGMVGYYNLPLEVVDCWGLTDRHVAHMAISERGRPGHEKRADAQYLVDRKVALSRQPLYPPPFDELTRVYVNPTPYGALFFGHYDRALRQAVGGEGSDFDQFLDRYTQQILPTLDGAIARRDFNQFFLPYYFSWVEDPPHRQMFEAALTR